MIKLKNIKIAIIFAISTLVAVCFSLLLIPAVTQTQQASTPASAAGVNEYGFQEDSEGNYLIYSRSDLDLMTEYYNLNLTMPGTNKHKDNNMDYVKFKLMKDLEIDETFHGIASGVKYYGPTMENAAYGTFDGNFHTITWDAAYEWDNGENTVGLFSVAGYGLAIKNLKLVANVRNHVKKSNYSEIGALIGYAEYGDVLIENCYVYFNLEIANTDTVDYPSSFGGFVGLFKPDRTDAWSKKIRYKLTIINSYYGGNTQIYNEIWQELIEEDDRYIYNGIYTINNRYKSFKPEIINSVFKYKYCINYKWYSGLYIIPDDYYSTGEADGILQPNLSFYDSSTATSNFTRAMTNDDLVWYVDMEDSSLIQKWFVPYWKLTSIKPNENGEGNFFTNVYLPDIDAETNNSNNEFSDEDVKNDIIKFQYGINNHNSTKSYVSFVDLHYIDYTFRDLNILPKQGCKYEGYTCENVISNESDNHIKKGTKLITINFEPEYYRIKVYKNDGTNTYEDGQYSINEANARERILSLVQTTGLTTRTGYEFMGISADQNAETGDRNLALAPGTTGDLTFYCIWKEKDTTYTVTVYQNYNSSDTTKIEQTFTAGQTIDLMEEFNFVRENFTLKGFSESKTGGTTLTKITNISRNHTLYAQWEEIEAEDYTITLHRNFNAEDSETTTITYNDQQETFALITELPAQWKEDATASQLNFVGFSTTKTGTPESVIIEKGTTKDLKYYCIWEENTKYRITFKASSETDQKEDCLAFVYSGWKIRALLHENPDEVKVSYVIDNTKGEAVILYEYKMTSGSPYYFTMESNIEGELIINEDIDICPTQVLREQNITFTYVNDPNIKMSIYVYVDVPGTAGVKTEKIKDATSNYTTTYLVRDGMGDSFRGQIGYEYYETTAGHRYRFEVRREPTWSARGNIVVYYEVPENYKLSYLNRDYTAKDNPAIDYNSKYYENVDFKDTISLGDEDEIIDHIACCSVIFTPVFTIRPPEVKPVTVDLTFKYNIDHAELYITDLTQSEPTEVLQTADYTMTLDLGVEITTETDIANNRYSYIIGDIKITYVVTEKKYWLKKYNLPGEDWFTSRNEPTWEVNQLHGTDLTIVPIITLKSYEVDIA